MKSDFCGCEVLEGDFHEPVGFLPCALHMDAPIDEYIEWNIFLGFLSFQRNVIGIST